MHTIDINYEAIFDNAAIPVFLTKPDGTIISCNKAGCSLFGYTNLEIQQLGCQGIIDQEGPGLAAHINKRKEAGVTKGAITGLHKKGRRIPLEFTSVFYKTENGEEYTCTTIIDISARKKAEEEMQLLINNTEECFVLLDRDLRIVSFNAQFKKLYTRQTGHELKRGECILDYARPEKRDIQEKIYRDVLDGASVKNTVSILLKNGSERKMTVKYAPAKDEHGNDVGVFVSSRDVTEEILMQLELENRNQQLKQAEASYSEIFEKATDGIAVHALEDFRLVDVNQKACEIMGCSKELLLGQNPFSFFSFIPDYSIETALAKFERAANGEEQQFEWLTKDFNNDLIWLEINLNKTSVAGKERVLSFFRKINDRKDAEIQKELDRSEKEALINNTDDLIWSVSSQLSLIACNRAFINNYYSITGLMIKPGDPVLGAPAFADDYIIFWKNSFGRALNGEILNAEVYGAPNGKNNDTWFDICFNPVYTEGNVVAVACYARNVTERKRTLESLRESNLRYLNVTKAASDAIWDWDLTTDIVFWGETYIHLFGNMDSDSMTDLQKVICRLHPDEKEELLQNAFITLRSRDLNWEREHRYLKADGNYAFVSNKALILRNEAGEAVRVIGAMQDITKQKQKQQYLELLESVILNANDSIMITEAEPLDGCGPAIMYVNDAFTKMTGYKSEEVTGKTPRILQGPKTDRNELNKLGNSLKKWERTEITVINYKKNGQEYWCNMSISPVANEKGWFTHWIAIERDVTEAKLLELKMQELNENLQKQARELRYSNDELEQFAYVASHDLQEPLRMVTSFLDLLKKRYSQIIDDKGKGYINFAVDGASRMQRLIMDLLEYSRIGRMKEATETVDLYQLIDELKILYLKRISESDAVIKVSGLPKLQTNKIPIRQVFQNLIGNALKYTTKGKQPVINVNAIESADCWEFCVADNGIGIDAAYFEKIFVIFQRLHNKDEYSGTGIGLAVTKKIIEGMGGSIWVKSEKNKGSAFHFTIPKNPAIISC